MTTYTIIRLGHHGDGIADGPVFAPSTLPGETVTGTLNGQRLSDIRIVTASPRRISPVCRHAKSCGGCQLQHADESYVAEWKQDVVQQALAAQGINTAFHPIITSPAQSRRRATLSVRRTKKGATAGFHGRASDVIVQVPDCQLLHPSLLPALPMAEALAMIGASRKAELSVTVTRADAGLDVSVTGGKPLDGPLRAALGQFAERFGLARLHWDGEVVAMQHPPAQRFGRASVVPPPGAFLQATDSGEAALLGAVRRVTEGANRIVDLFSGCGTFSLPLAERAEVHAVEGDPEMVLAMDQGWRKAEGLKRVTHEARDLFRRPLLEDEFRRFDAAVLDPPRAGAEAQVKELAASGLPRIAYVSCNPVTFARDAKQLIGAGYSLNWVQVVDQFRWSSHIELVGEFCLNSP